MKKFFGKDQSRRFNAYVLYLKERFGGRVQKLSIDAGFTCPNRDGTVGRGGCTYCNNNAFSPSYCSPDKSVEKQLEEGIAFHKKRYRSAVSYLAYFQAYTNTYAPLEELEGIYKPALEHPQVIGLVLGTRPDCVDDKLLDYFAGLNKEKFVVIEYGIESCLDRTLERINRGHDFAASEAAIRKTGERDIRTGAHMILGLPGESEQDMVDQAGIVSELPLHSIKYHQLQIVRNTVLGQQYQRDPSGIPVLDLLEYVDLVIRVLEHLTPDIYIERLAGEVNPQYLLAPNWELRSDQVLNMIEKRMKELDTWQGRHYASD